LFLKKLFYCTRQTSDMTFCTMNITLASINSCKPDNKYHYNQCTLDAKKPSLGSSWFGQYTCYDMREHLEEPITSRVIQPWVLIGTSGTGVHSQSLPWQLVSGELTAVRDQTFCPWSRGTFLLPWGIVLC